MLRAQYFGQIAGNIVASGQRFAEAGGGASMVVGGLGACLTSFEVAFAGCVVVSPAAVAGGSALTVAGTVHLVAGATMALRKATTGSPGDKPLIGSNGTRTPSKTVWSGKTGRVDVENAAPGKRDGQLHFQEWRKNSGKWLYDGKNFAGAPDWVNEQLNNAEFMAKVRYGWEQFLGMK